MLGKLIKHEFKATYKRFLLMYVSLICITILTRILLSINDSMILNVIFVKLFSGLFKVFIPASGIVAIVFVVARFNNHMLKDEGYLTHTLPAKVWQHLVAKGVVGTIWMLTTSIVIVLSVMIYIIGNEVSFARLGKFTHKYFNLLGDHPQIIGIVILGLIVAITYIAQALYEFMAALSLGQIFSKHRIAGAVLFWFIMNYAFGIIMAVLEGVVFSNLSDSLFDKIERYGIYTEVYIMLVIMLVFELVLLSIYFGIANFMLTRKLNLE